MLMNKSTRTLLALAVLATCLASQPALAQAAKGCAALAQWPATLK